MVGDGAFQVTFQEILQMVRHWLSVIIILMNNRAYTIEAEIHGGPYNSIQNWDYALFVQTLNSPDADSSDGCAVGLKATTVGMFSTALKQAKAHAGGPVLIECDIHQDDCTKELIRWGRCVSRANGRHHSLGR